MREILFRAKTALTDNPRWIEGYYSYSGTHWIMGIPIEPFWETLPINPETLGQFTGLYDKNGVKIFEGDIVKESFEGTRSTGGDYGYVDEDFHGYKIGRVSFVGTGTFITTQYGELWVDGEKWTHTHQKKKKDCRISKRSHRQHLR